jgi:hypothetical protein
MLKFCKENVCLLVFEQARSQGSSHVFIFNSSPQYYDSAKLRQSEGYISVSLGNYYSLSFIYKIIILYRSLIPCTLFRSLLLGGALPRIIRETEITIYNCQKMGKRYKSRSHVLTLVPAHSASTSRRDHGPRWLPGQRSPTNTWRSSSPWHRTRRPY